MIRIKFRDDEVFETLLLEDRKDVGPEIRRLDAPGCEAGRWQSVDVPVTHCPACKFSIASQLRLSDDQVERIVRWREAAKMSPEERIEQRMTAADLGAILDKIMAKLEDVDDHGSDGENDTHRIVVEVEATP